MQYSRNSCKIDFNINEITVNSKVNTVWWFFFYFYFCCNKDRNNSDTQTEVKVASASLDKSDLFPFIFLADGQLFFYPETCCYK